MSEDRTTFAVQRYLNELAALPENALAEPMIRTLIGRAVNRLHLICGSMLARSYPRLMQPPLNLHADEMLSSVVDRLLRALREVRPKTVRQFFALANQHLRWELNDLARRLDKEAPSLEYTDAYGASADSSGSQLGTNAVRILSAIESLGEDEREVFSLVRIQGMSHTEAAEVLGVSSKTVQRRLNRGLLLLTERLNDLRPQLGLQPER